MLFGILGETRAWHDDGAEVPLGGPARRALLALLLVRPGEVVSADRLAEEIDPAAELSAHSVQSQVSRLRAALGPAAPIERAGAGYRIAVADDAVDAGRFERLTDRGRAALRDGDAHRAAALLQEALGLWRGPALAEVAGTETARAAAVRLEELRLGALEDRFEAALRLGEHRTAVAELRELVGRHPLRERPAALLMRALAAQGGQAEALVVFEETRRHLADELGADPSPELAALHRELLDTGTTPAIAAPPAQLTSFVGRAEDAAETAELLRAARLVTLVGPGGVGKTRLAIEIAARSATDTGAGEVCFVELAPLRDGAAPAQALLGALGLRESGLHLDGSRTPVDRLIAALSDRLLLVVLDNCEHLVDETAELAARLLAACPRLRILATSREPLGIIGESLQQVGPLDEDAAARLFTDRAAAVRRGPTADPALVRRICAAVDGLPLAIELTAARLRTLEIHDLAERLDDRLAIAARGARTADQRHRTLRSVVAWGWELLSEPERQAARRFAVLAGGATAEAAAQVCDTDAETLESLADKSFLQAARGRYRMLETIRAYAAEQLAEAGEQEAAERAHTRYVRQLLRTADPHLRRAEQLDWLPVLAAEHDNVLTALRRTIAAGGVETALELLASASTYLWIRGTAASVAPDAAALLAAIDARSAAARPVPAGGPVAPGTEPPAGLGEEYAVCTLLAAPGSTGIPVWQQHRAAAERALATAWSGDRSGRYPAALLVWMMRNAGQAGLQERQSAFELVTSQRDCPEPWARSVARYVAGFGALGTGDQEAAESAFAQAGEGFDALGDRWGAALVLDLLAGLAGGRGDRARAIALTERALALTEELGALEDAADLLVNRGDRLAADDLPAAGADYARAAELAVRAGSADGLGAALRGQADLALAAGDPAEAERLYTEALERIDPHWIKALGNLVRTLAGLARVAEANGDRAAARTHYRRAAESAAAVGPSASAVLRVLGLPDALVEAVSRA
ncbi:BTAD domain-containing putative transcriptional regulator [Kitasatospora sp. CM 4170]|uniref:BTAD domain-containing putative transcriptional regulator n=1 Tax=Kitasatospora aburaviensis TaxID=67265 RepID=A0ABW1F8J9_9ACTN|nr:BTAD domain-containing putative transcriptional regulator [Kitasatospora sp. CM 4170]WNM49804.1 BTAD domain-containing putative transcriptional regulator [Kitasatospora sp. CM 4170]